MLVNKDPAIKLFGKLIQLGSISEEDSLTADSTTADDVASQCTTSDQTLVCSKKPKNRGYERCSIGKSIDQNEGEECSWISELADPKTPTTTTSSSITENPNKKLESEETSTNDIETEKGPKKPEEILGCPRCNSMNTKFCYFNNYNVSQPRHFCKNCQRYWTAGGTMRNMPVGSGRRKNKTSQLMSPEPPCGLIHQPIMSSNNNKESEVRTPFAGHGGGWRNQGLIQPQPQPQQVACFGPSLSPWPYAWNPIPWQFYQPLFPSPQWVCSNPTGPWNFTHTPHFLGKHCRDGTMLVPCNSSNQEPTPTSTVEKTPVSMPKTLRIADDPNEVARSSAWGSLSMMKDNKPKSSNIFGGFHHYKGVDPQRNDNNTILSCEGSHLVNQANPAAFSRSLSFHVVGQ